MRAAKTPASSRGGSAGISRTEPLGWLQMTVAVVALDGAFISIVAARPGLIAVVLGTWRRCLASEPAAETRSACHAEFDERRMMFTSARPAATVRSESR